jgi:hypothetical protein
MGINIDISKGMVLIDKDSKRPYVVVRINWNDDSNNNNTVVYMDLYRSGDHRNEKITYNCGDLSELISDKYKILITDTDFKHNSNFVNWVLFDELNIDVYPVAIMSDRYHGTYNGGYNFHAWSCNEDEIPADIDGPDIKCADAWHRVKEDMRLVVGFGSTPNVALLDVWLKQHGINVEDYKPKVAVEVKDNKVIITTVNEGPVEIDMKTAELISEAISSGEALQETYHNLLTAIKKDTEERVTDIAEMEEEPYHDDIDPEWYTMRLEELDLDNAALMISTYASDYDSDIDTAILQTEGGMLVVDVINKKTHESSTVFWNDDETFRVSFKERLLRVLRKLTT